MDHLPILITLDHNYIDPARVMLHSLSLQHQNINVTVYLLHSSLTAQDIDALSSAMGKHCKLVPIFMQDNMLKEAPITDRYPHEMYYRIFAARYLPKQLDKVLYLDPDTVILHSLMPLYQTDLTGYFYAAATHVREPMRKLNELRLGMEKSTPYINSGVLLIHLAALREQQDEQAVFAYIEKYKNVLFLPDQDIISGLYGSHILRIDPYLYNMTERLFVLHHQSDAWLNIDWVRNNSAVIHYCGRNKPWNENYIGVLDVFYWEMHSKLQQLKHKGEK